MNQDRDTLSCWLAEVVDAKDDQKRFRERAAAAARQFFQPKRQGVEVIQDVSDSGLKVCTETYATRECTADISIETKVYAPYGTQNTSGSQIFF